MIISANVTLMVSEFDRAVSFYTEKLGLTLKSRYGHDWAEVQAPGLTIGLHPAGERGPSTIQATGLSIGLGVSGIDQVVAELQAKGIQFAPPGVVDTVSNGWRTSMILIKRRCICTRCRGTEPGQPLDASS